MGNLCPTCHLKLSPLHELLQKECTWSWGPKQDKAFEAAKNAYRTTHYLCIMTDPRTHLGLWCFTLRPGGGVVSCNGGWPGKTDSIRIKDTDPCGEKVCTAREGSVSHHLQSYEAPQLAIWQRVHHRIWSSTSVLHICLMKQEWYLLWLHLKDGDGLWPWELKNILSVTRLERIWVTLMP